MPLNVVLLQLVQAQDHYYVQVYYFKYFIFYTPYYHSLNFLQTLLSPMETYYFRIVPINGHILCT